MTNRYLVETQQLVKFIEKQAFEAEEKQRWIDALQENGITQEIMDEVHKKYLEIPKEKFTNDWQRAKNNMEWNNILKHWRMDQARQNFKRSR